jgi:hypothetical protein
MDIISLFLKILRILGKKKDDWTMILFTLTYIASLS